MTRKQIGFLMYEVPKRNLAPAARALLEKDGASPYYIAVTGSQYLTKDGKSVNCPAGGTFEDAKRLTYEELDSHYRQRSWQFIEVRNGTFSYFDYAADLLEKATAVLGESAMAALSIVLERLSPVIAKVKEPHFEKKPRSLTPRAPRPPRPPRPTIPENEDDENEDF